MEEYPYWVVEYSQDFLRTFIYGLQKLIFLLLYNDWATKYHVDGAMKITVLAGMMTGYLMTQTHSPSFLATGDLSSNSLAYVS